MLPEKLESMVAARNELASAGVSTPRHVSRVRGKAIHFDCAIPFKFVAIAAPSLSKLMHRETGMARGLVEVPVLEAKKDMEFDWDRELLVSARLREALEFISIALERDGTATVARGAELPLQHLLGAGRDGRVICRFHNSNQTHFKIHPKGFRNAEFGQ